MFLGVAKMFFQVYSKSKQHKKDAMLLVNVLTKLEETMVFVFLINAALSSRYNTKHWM